MPRSTALAKSFGVLLFVGVFAADCGITQPKYIDYTGDQTGTTPTNPPPASTPSGETPTTTVSYQNGIQALLSTNCAISGCHVSGGQAPDLSTYAGAKANAAQSSSDINAGTMPFGGSPLSASDKALFKSWIDAGTP